MSDLIKVGMADYKVGRNPASLISYGLGSCVGIALYDSVSKVGGLAHIMLPDSTQARSAENPAKFADTALPLMLSEMLKLGATKSRVIAKIAGGAQMFTFANATDIMRVGERNAEAVRLILKKIDIRIIADDTGGNYGRTVELKLENGIYRVKTIDKGEKEL
ncbi:chemotaxis protein CheD [bacterium BFN5]|nr:chemotaxis protein CheD [bacterium BFN5]QJW47242.1 chemotaxis protein CheD [bacterium BFN5]